MSRHKDGRVNGRRTTVSVHVYIDDDVYPLFVRQTNKTRFINDAIRAYMNRQKPEE